MPTPADLQHATQVNIPDTGLRAAARQHRLAEQLEADQVSTSCGAGWSWQDLATRLGVAKQTVHRRYRHQEE